MAPNVKTTLDVNVQHSRPPAPVIIPGGLFVWPILLVDSVDSGGGTTAFTSWGWFGGFWGSEADATMTVTHDMTIESWTIQLVSALGGGESLTADIMVNGSPAGTMTLSCGSGETGDREDGTIALVADDVVSIRVVAAGGADTKIINGFMLGYRSANPFFATHAFPSAATTYISPSSGFNTTTQGTITYTFANPPRSSLLNAAPDDLTITRLTGRVSANTSGTVQPRVGGTNTGSPLAFGGGQTASLDTSVTIPRAANAAALAASSGDYLLSSLSGARVRVMAQYGVDADDTMCVIPSTMTLSGAQLAISTVAAQESHGMAATFSRRGNLVSTFENQVQLRWPTADGDFSNLIAATVTGTVTVAYDFEGLVRINGADALTVTLGNQVASSADFGAQDVSTAAVVADDLVNFGGRCSTGNGGNQGTFPVYSVAFVAS